MWDLPESGIEPMSPALAGEFFTTEPPGKPEVGKVWNTGIILGVKLCFTFKEITL